MFKVHGKKIYFRLAEISDAEFIYQLRIDPQLSKYMHAVNNSLSDQVVWLENYKKRENEKKEFYFVICSLADQPWGVIRIYDLRDDSFCWGSWIVKAGAPTHVSIESALMVYDYGFYKLGLGNCHFDAMKKNESVVRFHNGFGARIVNQDNEYYYYSISRTEYEQAKKKYSKYIQTISVENR